MQGSQQPYDNKMMTRQQDWKG